MATVAKRHDQNDGHQVLESDVTLPASIDAPAKNTDIKETENTNRGKTIQVLFLPRRERMQKRKQTWGIRGIVGSMTGKSRKPRTSFTLKKNYTTKPNPLWQPVKPCKNVYKLKKKVDISSVLFL